MVSKVQVKIHTILNKSKSNIYSVLSQCSTTILWNHNLSHISMEFHKLYHHGNPYVSSFENGITHHYKITTHEELIILLTHV